MGKVGERDDWTGDLARHLPELVALRRDIHRHPELGFDVQRTADFVAQRLAAWGISVHRGRAKTGVVGTLTGRTAGDRSIALRADMDALAIAEETDRPHRSLSAGKGTARAFSPAVRDTLERRLSEVANGIAAANRCSAEIHYNRRYPPLVNAPEPTAAAIAAAGATVGAAKFDGDAEPMTISDDLAFLLDARPGAYILLGSGEGPGLHSPSYDFNDEILPTGVAYWINLCRQQLGSGAAA